MLKENSSPSLKYACPPALDVHTEEDRECLKTLKGFFFHEFWPRLPVGASEATTSPGRGVIQLFLREEPLLLCPVPLPSLLLLRGV